MESARPCERGPQESRLRMGVACDAERRDAGSRRPS